MRSGKLPGRSPIGLPNISVRVNGFPIRAIVDSGSTINLISKDFARRLHLQPLPHSSISLKQANGQTTSDDRLLINLTIGTTTKRISTHVMSKLPHHFVIGIDTGHLFGLQINLRQNQVLRQTYNDSPPEICLIARSANPLHSLLNKYDKLFARTDFDVGRIPHAEHHIRLLPNQSPIALRPYRHSLADVIEIRRQISDLLNKKLIRVSKSPWAAPVTLAKKADGTKRLCNDFRRLNAITVDEREPIPIVQDVIDKLSTANIFSKLDMAWGYWQVAMNPESIEKTAFITPDGHFEWVVLPFGLKNAPPTFQQILRKVLGKLVNNGVVPYLDDIIVYTKTPEEHIRILEEVFRLLTKANIRLRREKCSFAVTEVEYLGFIVGKGKVRPSTKKTESVKRFPTPTSVKAIQRFVGLANYYRRFIPNFSRIAEPLTRLTRKDRVFEWNIEQQTAFDTLKDKLINPPVITIYRPDRPVILHTDASTVGIGSILMQPDEDGRNQVIAYYSRRLNCHEERYSASELECLAVVDSMEHFHVYVHGKHTDIYSDHSALQWLFNIKNPSNRLFRWSVRLSVYKYTIHHRSGRKHEAPDALSREPISLCISTEELLNEQQNIDTTGLRNITKRDGIIINKHRGVSRYVVPPSLTTRILKQFHENHNHPGIDKTQKLILSRYWWKNAVDDIAKHVRSCQTCQLVKPANQKPTGFLQPITTPDHPMNTWSIDTIIMGSVSNNTRAKNIQTIVDHHSRYIWAFATPKNTTATLVNILSQLFSVIGTPEKLISDNGPNLTAKPFRKFCSEHGVRHVMITPYHPQANGLCEKANGAILRGLRLAQLDRPALKWSTLLPDVVKNYNSIPHSATGFSPRFLQFGLPSDSSIDQTPVEEARIIATKRSNDIKANRKTKYDSTHKPSDFAPGDFVVRQRPDNDPKRNKLSPANTGPYIIIKKIGPETYRIGLQDNEHYFNTAHASQLKRFHPRDETINAGGVRQSDS